MFLVHRDVHLVLLIGCFFLEISIIAQCLEGCVLGYVHLVFFLHMNSQDNCIAISFCYFLYSSQTRDFFTSHVSLFFCLRAQALHFSKWFFPVLPFCSSSVSFCLFNFQVTFRKLSLFLPDRSNNPSSDLIGHISCLSLWEPFKYPFHKCFGACTVSMHVLGSDINRGVTHLWCLVDCVYLSTWFLSPIEIQVPWKPKSLFYSICSIWASCAKVILTELM